MQRRIWIMGGLVAVGLAACIMPWPSHAGGVSEVASIDLPDLDGDKKNEHLHIVTAGAGQLEVHLAATAGKFTHNMLTLNASLPLRLAGAWPRWQLVDEAGRPVIDV